MKFSQARTPAQNYATEDFFCVYIASSKHEGLRLGFA